MDKRFGAGALALVAVFALVLGIGLSHSLEGGVTALNRVGDGAIGVATATHQEAQADAAGFGGLTGATLAQAQPRECSLTYGYALATPTPYPTATPEPGYNNQTPTPTPRPTATPGPDNATLTGWECNLITVSHHDHPVVSDTTLTGTGETGSPLGVAVPLPAASAGDDGRLLGVVSGQWAKTEQVKSDWTANSGAGEILNKPSIPDAEQIRINEFIDADGVVTFSDYDLVSTYTSGNGKILFTEGTNLNPPIYFDITAVGKTGTDHRKILDALAVGDEFLAHNTASTPNKFVFGTIAAKVRQDAQGNNGASLANTNLFRFTYTIDAERGLDDDDQIGTGAARVHLRKKLMQRDMANMDTPTDAAVTKLQNALAMSFATRTLANLLSITSGAKTTLRADIPTGTTKNDGELTTDTALLIDNFDDAELGEIVVWHDEHHTGIQTLTGYTNTTAGVNAAGRVSAGLSGSSYLIQIYPLNNADKATLLNRLIAGRTFTLSLNGSNYITGTLVNNASFVVSTISFNINPYTLTGTLTNNHAASLVIESNIAARDEFNKQVFKENSPNIGGKGGTENQIWTRGSSNANAGWADSQHIPQEATVPFAASFRDKYSRSFVVSSTNANGEAFISNNNSVPSGAPSGVTDFLGIDKNDSGGTEQSGLADIAVGDWFRVERGGNYIIARIQFVKEDSQNQVWEYWFNPSTDEADTLAYDQVGTGSGEIRFYVQQQPTVFWLTSVAGTGNAITASASELTALEAGQMVIFIATAANTGATTININSLGTKDVKSNATAALSSGDIASGTLYVAVYDGTAFRLMQ